MSIKAESTDQNESIPITIHERKSRVKPKQNFSDGTNEVPRNDIGGGGDGDDVDVGPSSSNSSNTRMEKPNSKDNKVWNNNYFSFF